jgi:hypothetical protein
MNIVYTPRYTLLLLLLLLLIRGEKYFAESKGQKMGEGMKASVDYMLWSSIGHFPSFCSLFSLNPGSVKGRFVKSLMI